MPNRSDDRPSHRQSRRPPGRTDARTGGRTSSERGAPKRGGPDRDGAERGDRGPSAGRGGKGPGGRGSQGGPGTRKAFGGADKAAERPAAGARPTKQRPGKTRGRAAPTGAPTEPMRIAKAMSRAGLCSRRDAERWILEGRVRVNGELLRSPARDVGPRDRIVVDGKPLPVAEPVRLWRYYKPRGLVTTHRDPEGRPTVFDNLPAHLPRVMSIGRLDFNTEGLLLLTTDGDLARHLELPATGWLRRYRVRAHGKVTQAALDTLKDGIELDGVRYGPVEATLDKEQGANVWLSIALREGKNREVRRILFHLGLDVNRLIRVSFGPFQLNDLEPGETEIVRRRVLADQLGPRLAEQFGLTGDFDDEAAEPVRRAPKRRPAQPEWELD